MGWASRRRAGCTSSLLHVEPLDPHRRAPLDHAAPLDWTPPTPHDVCDLVAIGAGGGGLVSAKRAARRGAKSDSC
jgi:NADPH-dependent 2,4-dienoyl-CoA reductase/sulfur reductase-like enzyme